MKGKSHLFKNAARPLAHYPHAREANGFLFLSGMSARRPDGTLPGNDIRSQTKGLLENAHRALLELGVDFSHVIDVTAYLTDMNDYSGYNEIYNQYFDAETGPARTTVAVKELPGKNLRIEMKMVAVRATGPD